MCLGQVKDATIFLVFGEVCFVFVVIIVCLVVVDDDFFQQKTYPSLSQLSKTFGSLISL